MQALGLVTIVTALLFVILHRQAARRYLDAYEAAHGSRDPGIRWLVDGDPDPGVEDLRRRRLLLVLPAGVLTLAGVVLFAYGG